MNDQNDTIRQLAYALWQARGSPPGYADVDWLAAEQQVKGGGVDSTRKVVDAGTPPADNGVKLQSLQEDGLVNPVDGRGPLRLSDDQGDKLPLQSNLKAR